jgi:tRNA 2-selenouridine synthase
LLNDHERHLVGLCYKKKGRQEAVLLGLELIGPKMSSLAKTGLELSEKNELRIYCQRGGMRSNSMAWLWRQTGLSVSVLEGGYKDYRQQVLDTLSQPLKLTLLAGPTGVGKTKILKNLRMAKEQVIDLEGLAHHKGSAFGWIGKRPQPTNVQLENELAKILKNFDPKRRIWVESESRMIGRCAIPRGLWEQMQVAPRIYLIRNLEQRIAQLCFDYKSADREDLLKSLGQIQKRLGSERYLDALKALESNSRAKIARIALVYYDYHYALSREKNVDMIQAEIDASEKSTQEIVTALQQIPEDSADKKPA